MTDVAPGQSAQDRADELKGGLRYWTARMTGKTTEDRAWEVGAEGERHVAHALAGVRDWLILHDVPVGRHGANVDHVAIGPGGVVAINAKAHPKGQIWVGGNTLLVAGTRTDYLEKSRAEADRVARALTRPAGPRPPVRALIVVVGATVTIKSQPPVTLGVSSVHVCDVTRAAAWLAALPSVMEPSALDRLIAMARDPVTWGT